LSDQKDRLGDKIRAAEAAREDQWARQRDAQLLMALRERLNAMLCPLCKAALGAQTEHGIDLLACPNDHGAWIDRNTLVRLMAHSNGGRG
jgi:hypothetical protein